jgi:hypothetical protein
MSNRLKRLQKQLKDTRESADNIARRMDDTTDIDEAIDLRAELEALEIEEHTLEMSIEEEQDSISTKE